MVAASPRCRQVRQALLQHVRHLAPLPCTDPRGATPQWRSATLCRTATAARSASSRFGQVRSSACLPARQCRAWAC